jgi:hypothetical protein
MQTDTYKDKRDDLCDWLRDAFGNEEDDETVTYYRKHAADLIKYMTARGWAIVPDRLAPNGKQPFFECPTSDCPLG